MTTKLAHPSCAKGIYVSGSAGTGLVRCDGYPQPHRRSSSTRLRPTRRRLPNGRPSAMYLFTNARLTIATRFGASSIGGRELSGPPRTFGAENLEVSRRYAAETHRALSPVDEFDCASTSTSSPEYQPLRGMASAAAAAITPGKARHPSQQPVVEGEFRGVIRIARSGENETKADQIDRSESPGP